MRRAWLRLSEQIRRCRTILLLMDFDGTLAPIVSTPDQARLPAQTKAALRRLSQLPTVRVGVVSGRSLAEVKRLVDLPKVIYVGNHGLELQGPTLSFVHPESRRFRPLLRRLARRLITSLRRIPGAWVEGKGVTLSLHWRNVSRSAQGRFHRLATQALAPYLKGGTIRVTRGKRVLEVRPPVDWDKGEIIDWLLHRLSNRGGRRAGMSVIYLGDDRTDEDAFRVVNRVGGVSVLVGRPVRRTAATYWLKDPHEVRGWFVRLGQTLTEGRGGMVGG